jgi:fused signal recognition particle receptor
VIWEAFQRTARWFQQALGEPGGPSGHNGRAPQAVLVDAWLIEKLEASLLQADVSLAMVDALLESLSAVHHNQLVTPGQLRDTLRTWMVAHLAVRSGVAATPPTPTPETPLALLMVGVNGSGKTTTLAKLATWYQQRVDEPQQVLLAAGDTYRAAAVEQLNVWATRTGTPILLPTGGDPAAMAHQAVSALASGTQVALIDSAGRLHNQRPLMDELAKMSRVARKALPENARLATVMVLDANTGQNGLSQVKAFSEAVGGLDAVVLTKLDGSTKGGVVFQVVHDHQLPIWWVGTGERPEDLAQFDPVAFVEAFLGDMPALTVVPTP